MMLEMEVEKAVVAALSELELGGAPVVGLWMPTAAGALKGEDSPDEAVAVAVAVPPCEFDTYGICEVSLAVSIVLSVRVDLCPTGSEMAEYAGRIAGLLRRWNLVRSGDELHDLKIPGVFDPGGVHVNAGRGPSLDRKRGIWSVEYSFSLRGTVPCGE